jgi:membrane-associated phospholipid phosphatase
MFKDCPSYQKLLLPAVLAVAAIAALGVDMPIAGTLKEWRDHRPIVRAYLGYLDMFEPFGHGLGLVLVLAMVHQLDRGRRWAIPRLAVCALAAGGAADLVKMIVVRVRPNDFPFVASAWKVSVWASFGKWWPGLTVFSSEQSFPSAHTATAAGLAAGLIWLYPQGRWLFATLAALVGCQRVAAGAHYPSDVLTGAAVGSLVAVFFLSLGRLPAWFERWEQAWRRGRVVL